MSRRVCLLLRQSLTRSDSIGIPTQRDALTAHHEARGDTIVATIVAENTRGWKEDRADLTEAVALAKRDAIDTVSVYAIDRLARNVRILETVVHELAHYGVGIESLSEPGISDPLFRQVLGAIAESFSRSLSVRMRSVVLAKVNDGRHQGPPPWGFVRGGDDRLVPDDDTKDAVTTAFRMRLEGYGRRRIRDELAARFGSAPDPASIGRALRNPAYAGGVRGPGKVIVWDAHEGIVSRETWEAVQRARAERPKTPRRSDPHWLDGFCFCGCGSPLYRAETKPGSVILRCGASLDQRTCRNPVKGIGLERAARIVRQRFGADLAAVAAMRPAGAVRAMVARRAGGGDDAAHRRLLQRRERALLRRERILEQRADGLISRESCRVKVEAIDAEIADVDGTIAAGPAPVDAAAVGRAIGAATDLIGVVARAEGDLMRAALATVGARLVLVEGGPVLTYQEPFAGLVGVARD